MVFSRLQLLQRAPSRLLWGFWIRLFPVISFLCSTVKAVTRFRPKRRVIHSCLWGTYLNKLDKVMSWSLISLNLQYYNHSLLSYNHSQVMHSLLWSCFSGTIFHPFPKETTKYHCVALSLSILNAHFFRIIVLQELHL